MANRTMKVFKPQNGLFLFLISGAPGCGNQDTVQGQGLAFQPICNSRNGGGQLPDGVTDNGWVDIDDIAFF